MSYAHKTFVCNKELSGGFMRDNRNTDPVEVANIVRGHLAQHVDASHAVYSENVDTARVEIGGKEAYIKRLDGGYCASATNDFNAHQQSTHRLEAAATHVLAILESDLESDHTL